MYEGAPVGVVTSGTHAPTLGMAIALAYVTEALTAPGTALAVEIRGRTVPAEVVTTPFYRRRSALAAPPAPPQVPPRLAAVETAAIGAPAEVVTATDTRVPAESSGESGAVSPVPEEGES
jgi:hypothetical protein